jgi:hypothetical protein
MRNKLALVLLILLTTITVFGQETRIPQPTKFDEFGDVDEREFGPKLKSFYDAVRSTQNSQGFLIVYGGLSETPFKQTDYYLSRKVRALLKYAGRGYDAPQVTVAYGGLREKPVTELWIGAYGSEFPVSKERVEPLKKLDAELVGTEKLNFEQARIRSENRSPATTIEAVSDGTIKKRKKYGADFPQDLSRLLKKDAKFRAVLIFYADEESFDIEKSRQLVEGFLTKDFEAAGLDASRVKIVYGGYRERPEVEIWLLPAANGVEPEPVPDFKTAGGR